MFLVGCKIQEIKMKHQLIHIFLISILILSCSQEEKETIINSDKSLIEETNSHVNIEIKEKNTDTITEIKKMFHLPKPNMEFISNMNSQYNNLYRYLLINFDSLDSKTENKDGGYSKGCEFSQSFSQGISYYQKECKSGTSKYELTTPNTNISQLKSIFAILFNTEDYYHWSSDSLSQKTGNDGLDGAGGEYYYDFKKDKVKVTILYTD